MARRDRNIERIKENKVIIIVVAHVAITAFATTSAITYRLEIEKLEKKITNHERIANFIKKELVPSYDY